MAVVPGVLLDHVHEELAERDRFALGVLADVLAYTSGLNPLEAQSLLAEPMVHERAVRLLRLLGTFETDEDKRKRGSEFPPPFSLN